MGRMIVGDGKFGEYGPGKHFVEPHENEQYWARRGYRLVPVCTYPPRRDWVGLTERKIETLEKRIRAQTLDKGKPMTEYAQKLCRAIEAALKANNG